MKTTAKSIKYLSSSNSPTIFPNKIKKVIKQLSIQNISSLEEYENLKEVYLWNKIPKLPKSIRKVFLINVNENIDLSKYNLDHLSISKSRSFNEEIKNLSIIFPKKKFSLSIDNDYLNNLVNFKNLENIEEIYSVDKPFSTCTNPKLFDLCEKFNIKFIDKKYINL